MDDPTDIRFEEARKLIDDERFVEAVDAFTDFILLCPESEGAYGNRGLAHLSLGNDEAALRDFEHVVAINPDDAMGHAMIAEALRYLGEAEEALERVVQALELDPSEPSAHAVRAWLFAESGQFDCAAEDLEVFLAGTDDVGEMRDLHEVCRRLAGHETGAPVLDEEECEAILADHGFSFDHDYNDAYLDEERYCPYAHCIRSRPRRGQEAPCACPVFGYDCPGGEEQTAACRQHCFDP